MQGRFYFLFFRHKTLILQAQKATPTMEKKTTNHPKGIFWKNDVTTLILRLLVAYLCLIILQTAFYMIDKPYLGHIDGFAEAWNIAKGSFVYNIMSLLWTNCLFILLSILPFRIREKRWYQGILYAIFLITNTAMIVLNGSDVVYFAHTMKRVTLEETHFTSNSNNIPLLIDFLQRNLPIAIICVALIALLIYSWFSTVAASGAGLLSKAFCAFLVSASLLLASAKYC